jgi:nucleotide-binding universal stress UspA family protein
MDAVTTQASGPQLKSGHRTQETMPAPAVLGLLRVLVVVDGSERAGRVIEQVKSFSNGQRLVEAVLLNVQPVPTEGRLRGYGSFKREAIKARLLDDLGRRAVAAAGRPLTHARIVHKYRLEMGDATETILHVANEEGCDLIFVANSPHGFLQRWLQRTTGILLATTAEQVAALADVSVVVVK